MRGGVCYLFSNWKFAGKIIQFVQESTNLNVRNQIVIVKNNIGVGYGFRNQYELCLVLEKGKATYNGADFSNVQKMEHIPHDKDTHPHEKGLELLKRIINHSSQEGDLVLDCFAGSGSTLVACKHMKRNYIGIELDPKYHALCLERLATTTGTLF